MLDWCYRGMVYLSTIILDNGFDMGEGLSGELFPLLLIVGAVIAVFAAGSKLPGKFPDLKEKLSGGGSTPREDDKLAETIGMAGYAHDPKTDIYFTKIDAWQREMGYCRLYDEGAAPMGMIIDCEPIYFKYANKKWLIEFWKGQYDLTTGAEVGVYSTDGPELNIPRVFNGTFYECVEDEDMLHMSCTLKKNGKVVLNRSERHWWLTGFKLGMYSEPHELTMDISIKLKNKAMTDSFIQGLKKAGYKDKEITRKGNTVSLVFDKPKTPQPYTRNEDTDRLIQQKNKLLCDSYQEFVGAFGNMEDRMRAIKEQEPELYQKIINIGRVGKFISIYNKIRKYLN